MTAPYRSAGSHACPQCATLLPDVAGAVSACANGCGQWLPNGYVATLFDLGEIAHEPRDGDHADSPAPAFAPPPCPACGAPLVRAWLGAAPVRLCDAHGLWIAQSAAARFEGQLAAPMERYRRLREMIALLARADDDSRVAVARRVLDLEDRVAALEAELLSRLLSRS